MHRKQVVGPNTEEDDRKLEFFSDLYIAFRDHPGEVAICIAVPLVLWWAFGGDGPDGGWSDGGDD